MDTIKILTEGDSRIGLGHITRCLSIYEELLKRQLSVVMIIDGKDKQLLMPSIIVEYSNWNDEEYIQTNIKGTDIVMIDSYLADKKIYDLVYKNAQKLVVIDDYARLDYPGALIINPSMSIDNLPYSQSNRKNLVYGSNYVLLRSAFLNLKKREKRNSLKNILITLGGTDIRNLMPILINEICRKNTNIDFHIVIGVKSKIEDYPLLGNVFFYSGLSADEMRDLMNNSDYAITATGQTIYELLITSTPFFPILIADNQENNLKSLLRLRPQMAYSSYCDDDLIKKIQYSIDEYQQNYTKTTQINTIENLIDGLGASRIAELLLVERGLDK